MPTAERYLDMTRERYESFNERGAKVLFDYLDPEIEWISMAPAPLRGSYHGHQGVTQFFMDLFELFEPIGLELEDVMPVGDDQVLAFIRVRGRGKGTSVEVEAPIANLWRVGEDTKCTELQLFYDRAEALKAAGFEQPDETSNNRRH
jgi:ketosteroid isomerase-like protein